ncbi:hypothetical protein BJ322DRAFT_119081 [Thelephora terrestris]|uniref:Uncharacterized protein n=1 Tax=Thelephora terrestris TaxID=56493 RepID=A0A9P6HUF0_9AGAM|nr:hypothetical protein BJ322DRAFT_119081 [Thelephora terrestris]
MFVPVVVKGVTLLSSRGVTILEFCRILVRLVLHLTLCLPTYGASHARPKGQAFYPHGPLYPGYSRCVQGRAVAQTLSCGAASPGSIAEILEKPQILPFEKLSQKIPSPNQSLRYSLTLHIF